MPSIAWMDVKQHRLVHSGNFKGTKDISSMVGGVGTMPDRLTCLDQTGGTVSSGIVYMLHRALGKYPRRLHTDPALPL